MKSSNTENSEHKKDLRIQFLEEQARWNLLVSELLTSLGDLHHQASVDRDPQALLLATTQSLQKLTPFKSLGFFLVNEDDSDFFLARCEPESAGDHLQREVDDQINEGTFAWAIYQNKPVMAKSRDTGETLVLHVLATQRRVRGMFVGVIEGEVRRFPEKAYYPFSLVLQNTARGLESIALYELLLNKNLSLETRVRERTEELENQAAQLREQVASRTLTEESLKVAKEQLENALRAKSEFLTNISHEIRTPLNAILGYAEILRYDCEKTGHTEFVEDLKIIESAARHLLTMINDVLDMVKLRSGKMEIRMESFALDPFLQELITCVQPLSDKFQNQLNLETPPQLGTLVSDPVRLRQILLNLLSNACKFTQHGRITLAVQREQTTEEDRIRFVVTDTGIGMDPEQIETLFETFTRGESPGAQKLEGTGLGLSICSRLAEILGGDIQVRSQPGAGSEFIVTLPGSLPQEPFTGLPAIETQQTVSETAAHPGVDSQTPSPAIFRKSENSGEDTHEGTVLIGEDDPVFRNLLCRFLEKEDYHTEFAATGEAVLDKMRQVRPQVLLLGHLEGDVDALKVVGQLKEFRGEHPGSVIFMGDKPASVPEDVVVLTKPLNWEALLNALPAKRKSEAGKKILIIQTDSMVREILGHVLGREGWSVTSNSHTRLGFDALNQSPPSVVLLDFQVGIMELMIFLKEIRKRKNLEKVPIFLITSRDLTLEEEKRLNSHIQVIFKKGHFSRMDLLEKIARFSRA